MKKIQREFLKEVFETSKNWEEVEEKVNDYNWRNHRFDIDGQVVIKKWPSKFRIDLRKKYQTRAGHTVLSLHKRDTPTTMVLEGYIQKAPRCKRRWRTWTITGQSHFIGISDFDLIPKEKP